LDPQNEQAKAALKKLNTAADTVKNDDAKKAETKQLLEGILDKPATLTPKLADEVTNSLLKPSAANALGTMQKGAALMQIYSEKAADLLAKIKLSDGAMAKFTNEQLSSQASCIQMQTGYALNVRLDDLLRKKKADADNKWLDLTPIEYESVIKTLASNQTLFTKYSGLLKSYCQLTVKIPPPISAASVSTIGSKSGKYADAMAAFNAGMDYDSKGETDNALAAFQEAFTMNPKFTVAINNVGAMFGKKDDLVNAMNAYLQALHIDPNFELSQNNLEGIVGRMKTAIAAGTLKLSKQEFTNYYTARIKVYSRLVANNDNAANAEITRRSDTLDCSKLQAAYEGHYKFDSFLRSLKDDYDRGNTTFSAEDVKLLPQTDESNKRLRSQWFDRMHSDGCIVRGFYPEF